MNLPVTCAKVWALSYLTDGGNEQIQMVRNTWREIQLHELSFFRFDDVYELVLVFRDGKTGQSRDASFKKSVANFFYENGILCLDLLEDAVNELHKSLSMKKKES